MKKSRAFFISILLVSTLVACGNPNSEKRNLSIDERSTSETTLETTLEILETTSKIIPETTLESVSETEIETILESISEKETETASFNNIVIAYFSVPEEVDTNGVDAIAGASIVVKDGEKMGNTEYIAKLIQKTVGGDLFRIETVNPYPLEHGLLVDQAADEQDDNLRPALATHMENFEKYEYIFLGFPNWWADMPQPLYTFLEEYDFGTKTIIPFITHGGSGASRTVNTISQLQPEAIIMKDTLILSRNNVAESEETVITWAKALAINTKEE